MTGTTEGCLLGGRLRYTQPAEGFRSGIEPVLLAASVPARAGERVLEGGSGAGAALLCLASRVPGIAGLGIELDPALTAMARANAAANGFTALDFVAADLTRPPPLGEADHAIANPPYHPEDGTRSPARSRDLAKRGVAGVLVEWTRALAQALRGRGTLTLVLPISLVPQAITALESSGCGSPVVLPLWQRAGHPAKLCLIRGTKGGKAPFRLRGGLVLHGDATQEGGGRFTPEADAVLRDGAAIEL